MIKVKKQSFVRGALILITANFFVKIIGAIFKIPLANFLGKNGMGLFSVAYQIYTFMFIIATAGFPIAVSKMISEYEAKKRYRDCENIFKTALMLLGFIGLLGSILLFLFSKKFACFLGNEESYLSIIAISPAIFFVSILSVFRGYFQGMQNMYPTALSEIVEASVKLFLGLFLTIFFTKMTINPSLNKIFSLQTKQIKSLEIKTQMASSGAIFGVTCGTFLSLLILFFMYIRQKTKENNKNIKQELKKRTILKKLVMIAIPITIGASVSSITSVVDLATTMNRLIVNPKVFERYNHLFCEGTKFYQNFSNKNLDDSEILEKKSNILYGMYNGYAIPIFNLPLTIIVALAMCLVPAISSEIAKKNFKNAQEKAQNALKITSIFAMPCSFGVCALSKPILFFLYNGDTDAKFVLQKLSLAIFFVSIVSVSNSILQAYGKLYLPVFSMLIGGIIKIFFNFFLIPIYGVDAVPISTIICYVSIALLNLFFIFKFFKIKLESIFFIKIFLSSMIMYYFSCFSYNFISGIKIFKDFYLANFKFLDIISLLVTIFMSFILYIINIFLLRIIEIKDLLMLSSNSKINSILKKFNQ
ncbi:MAG: oligosaccharide flippase family protein [Clostridiales bacterium]|nr:oligosaccharide flippase family protein [Clostridiales bacterium]